MKVSDLSHVSAEYELAATILGCSTDDLPELVVAEIYWTLRGVHVVRGHGSRLTLDMVARICAPTLKMWSEAREAKAKQEAAEMKAQRQQFVESKQQALQAREEAATQIEDEMETGYA